MKVRLAVLALVCLLCVQGASAADLYWTGNAGTTAWLTPDNWNTVTAPSPFDNIFLANPAPTSVAANLDNGSINRYINNLTFNGNGGSFTLTGVASPRAVYVRGNVTVDAGSGAHVIDARVALGQAGTSISSTWSIGTGASLTLARCFRGSPQALAQEFNTPGSTVTKTGAGSLIFTNVGTQTGETQNRLGNLNINEGNVSFNAASNSDQFIGGNLSVASGASLTVSAANNIYFQPSGRGGLASYAISDIQETVTMGKEFVVNGPQTIKLSGANGKINGAAGTVASKWNDGTLLLDNTSVNVLNRYVNPFTNYAMNNVTLLGHDDEVSQETWNVPTSVGVSRNSVYTLRHGSQPTVGATPANAIIAYTGGWVSAGAAGNGVMVTLNAQNYAGNPEAIGTAADLAAATTNKSYVKYGGAAVITLNGIIPFGRAGAFGTTGSQFLTVNGGVLEPYTGATAALAGAGATDNVSDGGALSIAAATPINSLKLTGGSLDLGTNALTVGGGLGGGIIVTGASAQTISGGAGGLLTPGTANYMYLTNDVATSISAAVTAKGLIKSGTGKLTLTGVPTLTNGLAWTDGDLEYDQGETAPLTIIGGNYGSGQFVKRGESTVTMSNRNWSTGGVLIYAGTVVVNTVNTTAANQFFNPLGSGTTHAYGTSNLRISKGYVYNDIVMHDSSILYVTAQTNGGACLSGLTTLTDDSKFATTYNSSNGQGNFGGLTMLLRSSATFSIQGGRIEGNLTMSGSTSLNMTKDIGISGNILLSGDAYVRQGGNVNSREVQGFNTGTVTLNDKATWVRAGGNFQTFGSSLVQINDNASIVTNTTSFPTPLETNDQATATFIATNGLFTGTMTANDSSTLKFLRGNGTGSVISGEVSALGTSQVTIGSDSITSPLTVAVGAHLTLANGVVTSNINAIPDSNLSLGGATDGANGYETGAYTELVLTNTINISGSKTFNILTWSSSNTNPNVHLRNLSGSGDINVNGGSNSFLVFTNTVDSSLWTGDVNVQSGAVTIRPDGAPAGLGEISLAAGTRLFMGSSSALAMTNTLVGHTISGSGTVTTGDYTNVPDGSGKIISAGGTWTPGTSIGDLSVLGDLEFAMNGGAFAQLVIEAAAGPSYDRLLVSSATTTRGNLTGLANADLVLNIARSGWASYVGATLTIVTAVNDLSAIPAFNSVTWNNNMVGQVNYTAGAITLTHVGLAGDGNNDGSIDATDYADWFNNYGTTPTAWAAGDFNGDGSVDATDYALWFNNYGAGTSGGPVPEPATMTLLVLGGLAMLRRRK